MMTDEFITQLEDTLRKLRAFELVLSEEADREYLWFDEKVRAFLGNRHKDLDDTALSYVLSMAMFDYDLKKGSPEGRNAAEMCWYLIGLASNKQMILIGQPYQKKLNQLSEENRRLTHQNEAQKKQIDDLSREKDKLGEKLLEVISKQDDLIQRYDEVYAEFIKIMRKGGANDNKGAPQNE